MQVKAFSLMELIVVILLLGIIFSLILTNFNTKKNTAKIPDLADLQHRLQKLNLQENSVFYIYGNQCDKNLIKNDLETYDNPIKISFDKESQTYELDNDAKISVVDFGDETIEKKEQHICFKLNLAKGKFTNKYILKSNHKIFLFQPFFQQIKTYDTLEQAKEAYRQNDLIPLSEDDYYRE